MIEDLCAGDPNTPRPSILCASIEARLAVLTAVKAGDLSAEDAIVAAPLADCWEVAMWAVRWWPTASAEITMHNVRAVSWQRFAWGMARGVRPAVGGAVDWSAADEHPDLAWIIPDIYEAKPRTGRLITALAVIRSEVKHAA
jgi:hypothetical protein